MNLKPMSCATPSLPEGQSNHPNNNTHPVIHHSNVGANFPIEVLELTCERRQPH